MMDKRETQLTMLARIIEGQVEQYLQSVGIIDKAEAAYLKEACFTNILANTLLYRTVLERDQGKLRPEDMEARLAQRLDHLAKVLPECLQYQLDKHAKAATK